MKIISLISALVVETKNKNKYPLLYIKIDPIYHSPTCSIIQGGLGGGIFWTMIFYNHEKFTSRSI